MSTNTSTTHTPVWKEGPKQGQPVDLTEWSRVIAYDPRVPDVRIFGRSWTEKEYEVPHSLWLRPEDLSRYTFPRPLALVNGVFDLLHVGHLTLLWKARQIVGPGGSVVVALDSDEMVKTKKGPGRPYMSFIERASAIRFLHANYILEVNSDEEFVNMFNSLKPDIRVRDEGYKYAKSRVDKNEVTSVYIKRLGISTTELIKRIKSGE